MSKSNRKSSYTGLTICALVTFFGGAKIATLVPMTDAGRLAWDTALTGAAMASEVENVKQASAPEPIETPDAALAIILEERALLRSQKETMAEHAAQIALAREALRVEADRLTDLRDSVQALLDRAESQHQADISHLVDLYGTMKPKEAAALLTQMDLEVVVYVMTEMEPRNGAPILAEMPSGMAQAISQVVLERSKLPGDQRSVQVDLR